MSLAETIAPSRDHAERIQVRLTAVDTVADAIKTFELKRPDGGLLPDFQAGSHVDVILPTGIHRSYSLIGEPGERDRYRIGVAKAAPSRGGSAYMHDELRLGDTVEIVGPRNLFPLYEEAAMTVLIGGGIGITPLIAMIHRLESIKARWTLHYCARSRSAAAFLDFLSKFGDRVRLHFDDENNGNPVDLARITGEAPAGAHLYCCGPAGMLNAFLALTEAHPIETIHYESFLTDGIVGQGEFEVELRRSGKVARVAPGQTILDVLIDLGIDVDYNCQHGSCGTCVTRVLEGIPDHRDMYLTEAEQDSNTMMTICCSGSRSSRLVLDL